MDATAETQLSRHTSAPIVQEISDELPTLGSMSKRIQDRSSALTPIANSALTASVGSKTSNDISAMFIGQWKQWPLPSHAPTPTVALNSEDMITGLNTSGNIISNPPYNPINNQSSSEPDPASHWIRSDVTRSASFDEPRPRFFFRIDEISEVDTHGIALDQRKSLRQEYNFMPTALEARHVAYYSNEPNAVNNGNHWRREAAVSRHMDSSRSKHRTSQVMASISTNALGISDHSGTH